MNNSCNLCISVRRNLTSYWSTHICFILAMIPIFRGCLEMLQEAPFLFLIFFFVVAISVQFCMIMHALTLLNMYLVSFLQSMSINNYSEKCDCSLSIVKQYTVYPIFSRTMTVLMNQYYILTYFYMSMSIQKPLMGLKICDVALHFMVIH